MMTRTLAALVLCALVGACGSSRSGSIPRADAERLAAESERVAARAQAGDGCDAAALARRLVRDSAAFPRVRVSAVALAREITCVPPAPVAAQPASGSASEEQPRKHGHHHKRHKHGEGGE